MRLSLIKAVIIGGLLMMLAACSTIRLTYNNGAQLAWWWLDGYVDFSNVQEPLVKNAIDRWFEWHRRTQLPDYAALLASAQAQVLEPTTPAQACQWQQQVLDRLDPALERALAQAAEFVPGLGDAQWHHIEQRFAKANAEIRHDFLQPRPDERLEASVKRAVDRAESFYGSIDDAQRRVIAAGVAASPFDPEAWLAERERRQRDSVQTLRNLVAERADRDRIHAALRVLVERFERSPDPAYRSYQQRLGAYNCAFAAQIHNATTLAQRRVARERMKGWEDDLRALAAAP
jgi:hypothetical protein